MSLRAKSVSPLEDLILGSFMFRSRSSKAVNEVLAALGAVVANARRRFACLFIFSFMQLCFTSSYLLLIENEQHFGRRGGRSRRHDVVAAGGDDERRSA